MDYLYTQNYKPIDRLCAAIKEPAEVDFITGDKILRPSESYQRIGMYAIVVFTLVFIYQLYDLARGVADFDTVLVTVMIFFFILVGVGFLMLERRRIIITKQGIRIVDFLGRSSQFDWPQVRNVGYKVWDQRLVFYLGDQVPGKTVSLYYFGIGDLAQSLRDNLKPEVYQPALFVLDYISHSVDPAKYPSSLSDKEYGREINNQLLGGGSFWQRYFRVLPTVSAVVSIAIGILMGIVGLYDLIVTRSDDASNLAVGLVLIAIGLIILAFRNKDMKKKIFWIAIIILALVLSIYILSIL